MSRLRQLRSDAIELMEQFKTNASASSSGGDAEAQIVRLLTAQLETSNVTMAGTVVVAAAVGRLRLGTLKHQIWHQI